MFSPHRQLIVLGAILLLAANCGGGGSSGPSPAPVISNLRITALDPESVNTTVRYEARVDFSDPQGDIPNGFCEITLSSIGTISIQITTGADVTEGWVACYFWVRVNAPRQIQGSFTLIDRAENRSNALSFVLGIRQVPSGQVPPTSTPAGDATMGGESAMLGRR